MASDHGGQGQAGQGGAVLSATSLERTVPEAASLLIDSSTLIAYFDKTERTAAVAAAVIDGFVRSGRNTAVVSVVSITELLVRPFRESDFALADRIVEFLTLFPNLKLHPIDVAVAREAGLLRARLGFGSPDALILASGLVAGCRHILANDRAWSAKFSTVGSQAVILLDDHLPFPA